MKRGLLQRVRMVVLVSMGRKRKSLILLLQGADEELCSDHRVSFVDAGRSGTTSTPIVATIATIAAGAPSLDGTRGRNLAVH